MTADLVARLEARASRLCGPDAAETVALLREAASALRSSGEAVAWAVRDHSNGELWMVDTDQAHASRQAELNDDTLVPLYLHPATPASAPVSNEDIHLAAQMLTWGMQEGLTSKQYDEVIAHQRKLLAATTPPTSTKA